MMEILNHECQNCITDFRPNIDQRELHCTQVYGKRLW